MVKTSIGNIQDGKYAVAVFLDENGRNELDRNISDTEREMRFFQQCDTPLRPATFEEARFEINGKELFIQISLK